MNRVIKVDYAVDTKRILGNTSNANGTIHARFQLFVRWPEPCHRKQNPFTYNGNFHKGIIEPHQQICSLLRLFQRNFAREQYVFAFLYDTFFPKDDVRRTVMAYVSGVVEETRLKNYYMMLDSFPLIDLLKFKTEDYVVFR